MCVCVCEISYYKCCKVMEHGNPIGFRRLNNTRCMGFFTVWMDSGSVVVLLLEITVRKLGGRR